MARTKLISVRLDESEVSALRRLPGGNDGERVRLLIQNAGAGDGFAQKLADSVFMKLEKRIAAGDAETQRLVKALGPLLNQVYQKLSQKITERKV